MNVFDIGIILVLIMFYIVGSKMGVVREVVQFVGIILVLVISYLFKGYIGDFLCMFLPFIKFKGALEGISVVNILLYQSIAFLLLFSLLLSVYIIVMKVSKLLQKIVNFTIVLLLPSKILGGVVSIVKACIIMFVVFLALAVPLKNEPIFKDSFMVNVLLYKTPVLSSMSNQFLSSITEVYDLAGKVANKEISSNEANLEALDVILKYKVTSKNTIITLKKFHKLDDLVGIENVLNKY